MVLDAILLNTQHYKVQIKCKWSNPGKGVAPSPTSWCSSYRKGSPRVTLHYGCQLYLLFLIIYTSASCSEKSLIDGLVKGQHVPFLCMRVFSTVFDVYLYNVNFVGYLVGVFSLMAYQPY